MKKLNSVENINENNVVILRMDTDLPMLDGQILDNSRLVKSISTIKLLLERKNKIVVVGHLGRPKDKENSLSLKPIYLELMQILEADCGGDCVKNIFVDDIKDEEKIKKAISENEIIFGENLRFYKEEEGDNTTMFEILRKYANVYVNDAFAVAHRKAASIILHREMEAYYGLSFIKEAEKINFILENSANQNNDGLVVILGGAKIDKLNYLDGLLKIANQVLIGGKLPKLVDRSLIVDRRNVLVAELRQDGLDLSGEDIENFKKIINEAKTIVWAGAMGFYEDKNCQKGTEKIALAVAENEGYKIVAGGDTAASIKNLGLENKIDFVCSGGGVMLEMLIKGSLPAWE
ncbi:MAG: phosphoglycerate kinase [Candidatus Shapirobacteria bacterium]|nr:phosphoglycerate kinase [Candidatus Shapirobacteria bacterium]